MPTSQIPTVVHGKLAQVAMSLTTKEQIGGSLSRLTDTPPYRSNIVQLQWRIYGIELMLRLDELLAASRHVEAQPLFAQLRQFKSFEFSLARESIFDSWLAINNAEKGKCISCLNPEDRVGLLQTVISLHICLEYLSASLAKPVDRVRQLIAARAVQEVMPFL
jgi:hypothetical protein